MYKPGYLHRHNIYCIKKQELFRIFFPFLGIFKRYLKANNEYLAKD